MPASDMCSDGCGPLVSVIVPVYNVEPYIEQCARSIFEQTYPRLDIIFVDDASPDGSIARLRQVLEQYPNRQQQTRIIAHDHNQGLSAARRTGLTHCKGKYIMNCDSDDFIDTDMASRLTREAVTGGHDIVASSLYIYNAKKGDKILKICDIDDYFRLNSIIIDTLHFSLCNKLIKRELLVNLSPTPSINCWEDLAMTSRAIALASSPKVIDTPFYHYRESPTSLTAQSHQRRLSDQLTVARFVEQWFISQGLAERYAPFLKYMKFTAKIKFLRGSKRDFRAWKRTFPEANRGIMGYKQLPLHYRLLFALADLLTPA